MGPLGHSLATLSALLAAPVGVAGLALRPQWRIGVGERLGGIPVCSDSPIWLHGSSMGEAQVIVRVARALLQDGDPVVLSAMTETGRQRLRSALPEQSSFFAPLDHPWIVSRALKRIQPSLLVLVETELWPAWIRMTKESGAGVLLLSGRISDRSWPRYRRFSRYFATTLKRFDAVGARSQQDAERFAALGVPEKRLRITGDLKFEATPITPLDESISRLLPKQALIVAGSTHAGEEEKVLQAWQQCNQKGEPSSLVLVPRYVERANDVLKLAKTYAKNAWLRSSMEQPLSNGDVLVVDRMGELAAFYQHAAITYVGGSLVPRGGHNLLEPLFAKKPVLFGPHHHNAGDAARFVLEHQAGKCVETVDELADGLFRWLRDTKAASALGLSGYAALEKHRGSLERSMDLLRQVLHEKRPVQ